MSETDLIHASPEPRTRESLAADLRALGIAAGSTLLVHSSLKALGWVSGGAVAVIQALWDVVTPAGTLVMPAMSPGLSDPGHWQAPPVPVDWQEPIRRSMPAFDPLRTPSSDMGRIAELFRTWPGVRRSDHPTCSLAALGPQAEDILRTQPLADPFGEHSPLARLYQAKAEILLLGVTFESCTALHLAERRAWPQQGTIQEGAPLLVEGERRWVRYEMPILRTDLLEEAGQYLMTKGILRSAHVGSALCHLLPFRETVDISAERWRDMEVAGG